MGKWSDGYSPPNFVMTSLQLRALVPGEMKTWSRFEGSSTLSMGFQSFREAMRSPVRTGAAKKASVRPASTRMSYAGVPSSVLKSPVTKYGLPAATAAMRASSRRELSRRAVSPLWS